MNKKQFRYKKNGFDVKRFWYKALDIKKQFDEINIRKKSRKNFEIKILKENYSSQNT